MKEKLELALRKYFKALYDDNDRCCWVRTIYEGDTEVEVDGPLPYSDMAEFIAKELQHDDNQHNARS